jgi:translation initiation factor 2B subunit (eIF-2B alpha/beta/delta family)
LYKCHSVLICADTITKTGGVLSGSGSLMMCMMARRKKIPVIVVSRNYCLSDTILLNQKSLTTSINSSDFFKIDHNDFGLYITKNEDYIEGKYIDLMISERGCWMIDDISYVQDQYWRY